MAKLSHKLKNSFEGALAGGGDPATSPLYVFGPFLKLIVVAGIAEVTYGASIWLVVLTIAVVSAMYRLVMAWVTDGSGGSGLSEEEFGGWAVKVNAAITFIEYTLTFLVSMAAMVTFIADRFTFLSGNFLGIPFLQYRTVIAILLSLLTGWLVNRGPKMAARTFGPATAGVLALLWVMVIASLLKQGFHLPPFNLRAFHPDYINFTIGGYARILAVMTGIEVFANLVAAYDGTPAQKSRKAFISLLIVMGTTAVTMLIVGPVIYNVSNPADPNVSVFTQTMDYLLPDPLPYVGTLVGVVVLMSASAASAQGLQNLALGLRERRYIPPRVGQPNQYEVADIPVWIEVGIVSLCFLIFGTQEDTYLALYAAGVFILLSMTGWAVTKRLIRNAQGRFSFSQGAVLGGTIIAATLTSGATLSIFGERFLAGAWTYFIFIPVLYLFFTYFRSRYGAPSAEMDFLGQVNAAQLAGFGFGQAARKPSLPGRRFISNSALNWQPDPNGKNGWRKQNVTLQNIVVLLDGSQYAAQALPMAGAIAQAMKSRLTLLSAIKKDSRGSFESNATRRLEYLEGVINQLAAKGIPAKARISPGSIFEATIALAKEDGVDLVVTTTVGGSGKSHWPTGGLSHKLVQMIDKPVLLIQSYEKLYENLPRLDRILIALDGSVYSERVLPYARLLARSFNSELDLLCVPAVPEAGDYRAATEVVEQIRRKAEAGMRKFLETISHPLRRDGLDVRTMVTGSIPAYTVAEVAETEQVDLIMLTSQGRGGYHAQLLGNVAEHVVENSHVPVFMVPIQEDDAVKDNPGV
jgi:nucleotide-binding universal stress UspA family protein